MYSSISTINVCAFSIFVASKAKKDCKIAREQQNIDETLKILGLSYESRSPSCSSNSDTSVSPPRNSTSGLGTPQRKQPKHTRSVSGHWSSSEESYSPPKRSSHNHSSPKRSPRKKLIKPSSKARKPQGCTSSTPIQDRSSPFNKTHGHTPRSSPRNRSRSSSRSRHSRSRSAEPLPNFGTSTGIDSSVVVPSPLKVLPLPATGDSIGLPTGELRVSVYLIFILLRDGGGVASFPDPPSSHKEKEPGVTSPNPWGRGSTEAL